MPNRTVKIVDLFAGIGGLKQGALEAIIEAGYNPEVVFTSEIKKDAIKTLQANWPDKKISGDITKIVATDIPQHDLLLAGFPCQTFSTAGNRKGFEDTTKGTLFFDVLRILKHHKPKHFILENVEGLIKHDPDPNNKKAPIGRTLTIILTELQNLGYNVAWELLEATNFGVPQARKRIFIIGDLRQPVSFTKIETKQTRKLKTILEKKPKVTLTKTEETFQQKLLNKYDIKSLVGKKIGNKRGGVNNIHTWDFEWLGPVTTEEKTLLNKLLTERRKKVYAIARQTPNKDSVPLTEKEIATFYTGVTPLTQTLTKLTKQGYLIKRTTGYDITGGKLSFPHANILDPEHVTPTLVASDADRLAIVEGNQLRRLTEKEFKRLFGFKDSYKIPEGLTKRAIYDLFGNSVVIPMAKAVTKLLIKP